MQLFLNEPDPLPNVKLKADITNLKITVSYKKSRNQKHRLITL